MSQYTVGRFQIRKPFLPIYKQERIRHIAAVSSLSENQTINVVFFTFKHFLDQSLRVKNSWGNQVLQREPFLLHLKTSWAPSLYTL